MCISELASPYEDPHLAAADDALFASLKEPLPVEASPRVQELLASLVQYLEDVAAGKRDHDRTGVFYLLNDTELSNWMIQMNKEGRVDTLCFLRKR